MSVLYLGVVVLPLLVLVWNLGLGGTVRRRMHWTRTSTPSAESPAPSRLAGLRARPAAFAARLRAALTRSTPPAPEAPVVAPIAAPAMFELAPDVPRSPSSPGWVPASGYAARPGGAVTPSAPALDGGTATAA